MSSHLNKNRSSGYRSWVLTVMKITILWDVMLYSLVVSYQCFTGTCCLCLQECRSNTDNHPPDCKASHPRLIFIFTAIRTSDLTWDKDATHIMEATNVY